MNLYQSYLDFFSVSVEDLQKLIATALERGGDYADLFFEYSTLNNLILKDKKVAVAGSDIDFGVGIRVLKGDQTGYAYAESTKTEKMMEAAKMAAVIASGDCRATAPVAVTELRGPRHYPEENSWDCYPAERKIEFLQKLDSELYSRDSRIVNVRSSLSDSYDKFLFFNSLGEMAADSGPLSSVSVNIILKEGERTESCSASRSFRMGSEMLGDALIDDLCAEVLHLGSTLMQEREMKGGEMPVVMAAGASGILLHEAIGHAFEADFNRKQISIFSDKFGKKICDSSINIVDDATLQFNRGSINFDDEGVPGQKTYMVKDGVLNSYLHDRISAKHYGVAPTGNGRRESFRFNPIPRMRATYMENGAATEADLIAEVKNGVFVENFSNGQVQIGAGDFTFFVLCGHLIENGRLTCPVKDINVIGNGPEALAAITGVANNCKIDNGTWTCGKGQNVPVCCGMPSVLVGSLTVGGR